MIDKSVIKRIADQVFASDDPEQNADEVLAFARAIEAAVRAEAKQEPIAWLVYLPSIQTQHVYDDQDDPGYVDDLTNHDDAEVTPLYAAPVVQPAEAKQEPVVTDAMALAFHNALTDGSIGQSEVDEIKVGLRAALIGYPVVQPGMVMVPIEPTEKMILAGDGENHMTVPTEYVADIWKAMIAAAQEEA